MTAEDKRARRDRIKHVQEARKAQMTYWLSRDKLSDGSLSAAVDVWLVRPERVRRDDGSSYYRVPQGRPSRVLTGEGPREAHHGAWTLGMCLRECRTYPDDDMQVIRVGDDAELPYAPEEGAAS